MANLRFPNLTPKADLSPVSSPPALKETLHFIFSRVKERLWLVGGTALAGYYAEHRRSDDLDLFAEDQETFRMTVLTVKALQKEGAQLKNERSSPLYYHTDVAHRGHAFTVDIVLDEYLHRLGTAVRANDGVWVADLCSLFSMKSSCLVSRCSEKDLFDLDWLIAHAENFSAAELIRLGSLMDGGLNAETLLFSLKSATLRKEACHFLLPNSPLTVNQAHQKILDLQKFLISAVVEYEKKLPLSENGQKIKQALKDLKKSE